MSHASAGIEVSNPQAYQAKLKGLLGGRDPLEVMAATPDAFAAMVRAHSVEAMRARPFEGKWTPCEILGHMIDTEWVYGYRLRLILCEDRPTILGMNQEKWVAGQRYNERDPGELVETFRALRSMNLALWKRLAPPDLERVGEHNERGVESLGLMLLLEAGHDVSHIDQMKRYLAAPVAAH